MRVSVILGHPDPKSFNHALAGTAVATLRELGHEVRFHDLQAEGFDPVLPAAEAARDAALPPLVARHCREIREADGLVLVHQLVGPAACGAQGLGGPGAAARRGL